MRGYPKFGHFAQNSWGIKWEIHTIKCKGCVWYYKHFQQDYKQYYLCSGGCEYNLCHECYYAMLIIGEKGDNPDQFREKYGFRDLWNKD